MATNTFSTDEVYGAVPKKVELAVKPSVQTVLPDEEDGPEKILARIEADSGQTFSPANRAVAIDDIRNGATFDIAVGGPAKPATKLQSNILSTADVYGPDSADEVPVVKSTEATPKPAGKGFMGVVNSLADTINKNFGQPTLDAIEGVGNVLERRYKEEFQGQERAGNKPFKDEELEWKQRLAKDPTAVKDLPKYMAHLKPQAEMEGFINSLENPIKLITTNSLPANFLSYYSNLDPILRKKFDAAQQVLMQEDIVANPSKFPAVSVAAAKAEIDKRAAKQDPGVRQMWSELKQAASEDPGKFGAELVNAIVADPELIAAPMGLGTRVLARTAELAKGAQATGKVLKLADKIIDAGSVAGALNVAITAQDKMAQGVPLTSGELRMAFGMGAVIGGTLGGIFSDGAKAKITDLEHARQTGRLEEIIADQAKYDVEMENAISHPDTVDPTALARINEALGITSKTDRAKMVADRRREAKATFKNETDLADYEKAKAAYRMERLAAQQETASARAQAEAAQRQAATEAAEVRITSPEAPQGVEGAAVIQALAKPGHLRTAEDLIAIRALKSQSGKVDDRLLKAMGVTAAAGAAGAAMFPEAPEKGALAGVLLSGLGYGKGSRGRLGVSKISQEGAIRLKGEHSWHPASTDDLSNVMGRDNNAADALPAQKRLYDMTKSYLNKFAGTKEDPLNDIILPSGHRWEDLMDKAIDKSSVWEWRSSREGWADKVPDESTILSFSDSGGGRPFTHLLDFMRHVEDYLRTVPEEKLKQYDLPRAVKETVAWDKANLAKAAKARVKSMEGMPVHKEYPDGSKWVQLTKPGEFAQESDVMGHSVRGYEPYNYSAKGYDAPNAFGGRTVDHVDQHPDWIEASGDSGHAEYGVGTGGWDAIKDGSAKVYSLRGPDGQSHVTVEVEAVPLTPEAWYASLPDGEIRRNVLNTGIEESPAYQAAKKEGKPELTITQIKGKGNAAPAAKYLPMVQDFVKSGEWAEVGDIQNTGLVRRSDAMQRYSPEGMARLDDALGKRNYYTKEEYAEFAKNVDWTAPVPRGQGGKASPELLARTALVATAAAAGFALAPDERSALPMSIAFGLAGLVLPAGGGNVLRKMRQSGAISADGTTISLTEDAVRLIKEGKLRPDDAIEKVKSDDLAKVNRAKSGDQRAMQELYESTAPKLERMVTKMLRDAGPKLAIDASDVVQETMVKAFQNLDSFRGDANFFTWTYKIAENEALNAIEKAKRQSGIADTVSYDAPNRGGDETSELTGAVNLKPKEDTPASLKSTVDSVVGEELTPEDALVRAEADRQLAYAISRLEPKARELTIQNLIEGKSLADIQRETGEPMGTLMSRAKRARDEMAASIAKGYGAKQVKTPMTPPRSQRGAVDEKLLKTTALVALGAGAGAYLDKENRAAGAGIGALAGLGLRVVGKNGKTTGAQIVEGLDNTIGLLSTRIMNKSKELWMRALDHERVVLRDTYKHLKAVDPFLVQLQDLKPELRGLISRAILTGDPVVVDRFLAELGNPKLIEGWKAVRSTLDSLGDQLVHLKRFKKKLPGYFPRIVKDVPGLLKALGNEQKSYLEQILSDADVKSIKARGTGLSDLERSLIINNALKNNANNASQPGYAKKRGVDEITPELQKFYATPTESLHSYIRSAVQDIQRAKFFGDDLETVKRDGLEYTNADESVGKMVDRLITEGKIKPEDQAELSDMLKARFVLGERTPNEFNQMAKNLSTAGLLGNVVSAVTQGGDIAVAIFAQDLRSTLGALARQLTNRKIVNMKDFGLSDHIAEEFVSTTRSAKFLNQAFKYGLFKFVDEIGKNTALNAAVIRAGRLAKTEKGIAEIGRRYAEALGPAEFKQLITDLQKGEKTDLVNQIAFAELSRTQPISRLEMPQKYLENPNGRMLYQFKSYMLKQADLVRRESYNEIKAGNYARGFKNLTTLGLTLGVAGMSTQAIKDWMLNRPVDLSGSAVLMNALKTFGLSQYTLDRALGVSKEEAKERRKAGDDKVRPQKAEFISTAIGVVAPPWKVFEDIATRDPKAWRYIPVVGPLLYEHVIKEDKK